MLEQLFGSRTRIKLLRLFLGNPDKEYFVRELTRLIDERINSVRRELANLENVGLVSSLARDKKRFYRANGTSPVFEELRALILKSQFGLEEQLIKAVQRVGRVHYMVLTGMFTDVHDAKTDMLIVGRVNREKLKKMVEQFNSHFDREINYTVMTPEEYSYRKDITDKFLYHILENQKIVVIDDNVK